MSTTWVRLRLSKTSEKSLRPSWIFLVERFRDSRKLCLKGGTRLQTSYSPALWFRETEAGEREMPAQLTHFCVARPLEFRSCLYLVCVLVKACSCVFYPTTNHQHQACLTQVFCFDAWGCTTEGPKQDRPWWKATGVLQQDPSRAGLLWQHSPFPILPIITIHSP